MSDARDLADARAAAATLLRGGGYDREAAIVAAGDGDDFAEVRMARALIPILARRERAAAKPVLAGRRLAGEEC